MTQPHLQISFTLTPSGSLKVTLLQVLLYISPSFPQWYKPPFISPILRSVFHSWFSVLCRLLPISLLVFMSSSLIQLLEVIFLQFCLEFFQAGSHPFPCVWLPSSSIPWLPNSTASVEGHQQNFLYLVDVRCFCSFSHTKWKSFSVAEPLACRWNEDTWFPRKQVRAPVTRTTVCNRKC